MRIASMFLIQQIPCRTANGRFSPTYPAGDWRTWGSGRSAFCGWPARCADFCQRRRWSIDIIVTGPLAAALFASTSGTDSDFVVKLIDVYPDNAQKNAWELKLVLSLDSIPNR